MLDALIIIQSKEWKIYFYKVYTSSNTIPIPYLFPYPIKHSVLLLSLQSISVIYVGMDTGGKIKQQMPELCFAKEGCSPDKTTLTSLQMTAISSLKCVPLTLLEVMPLCFPHENFSYLLWHQCRWDLKTNKHVPPGKCKSKPWQGPESPSSECQLSKRWRERERNAGEALEQRKLPHSDDAKVN